MRTVADDGTYSFNKHGVTGYGKIISFGELDYETETVNNSNNGISDRIRYYFFSEETINQWLE